MAIICDQHYKLPLRKTVLAEYLVQDGSVPGAGRRAACETHVVGELEKIRAEHPGEYVEVKLTILPQ